MATTAIRVARRPRAYLRVAGPDAASFLERVLSNAVEDLDLHDAREALLLTPKARVIAPMLVWRRGPDDFLLLTEPELGERLRRELLRLRFASRCDIEPETHTSWLLLGGGVGEGIPNPELGVAAVEVLDREPAGEPADDEALESLRIRNARARWGAEIDDRVLPAEAGLEERAISFTKGCYPGQEPVARQHYRGRVNRSLRPLRIHGDPPPRDAELTHDGKPVGRVTSTAVDAELGRVALAYVRVEVPDDAELVGDGFTATPLH
jgi:folate-binding protein YgfZ